jgi:hypothetical protein
MSNEQLPFLWKVRHVGMRTFQTLYLIKVPQGVKLNTLHKRCVVAQIDTKEVRDVNDAAGYPIVIRGDVCELT